MQSLDFFQTVWIFCRGWTSAMKIQTGGFHSCLWQLTPQRFPPHKGNRAHRREFLCKTGRKRSWKWGMIVVNYLVTLAWCCSVTRSTCPVQQKYSWHSIVWLTVCGGAQFKSWTWWSWRAFPAFRNLWFIIPQPFYFPQVLSVLSSMRIQSGAIHGSWYLLEDLAPYSNSNA